MTDTATVPQQAPPSAPTAPSPAWRAWLPPTGILLALTSAFLFSWKPLFVKLLYGYDVDAETQLALRMGLSLPFYIAFAVASYRRRQRQGLATDVSFRMVGFTLFIGILGYYVATYLDFVGLKMITASFERLILFTYPTFVAIIAWATYRQRPSSALLTALALTYAGLGLIFVKDLHSFGPQVVTGTILILICSLAYALYLAWSSTPILRMGSQLFTFFSMLSGTLLLFVQFALAHPLRALAVPWPALGLIATMAIGATVIPSLLLSEAIARIGPGPASVTGGAGPIMTTLLAVWLLGEQLTIWHAAGMALVIAGVVVLSRQKT